jgi:hypothetical protein
LIARHLIFADIIARRRGSIGATKRSSDEALAEKFAVIGFRIRLAEHGGPIRQ